MIIFYTVPRGGDPTNPAERTEWGRTIDGAIIENHGKDAAPDDFPYKSFKKWVSAEKDGFLEGFSDPLATLQRFNIPPVVAGIPARNDADTEQDIFFDGDYAYAERYGDLSEQEHMELTAWEHWDVATVNPGAHDLYKNYDYPDRFNIVVVSEIHSNRQPVTQGFWDTETETILGDVSGRFETVLEKLDDRVPLDNAVEMVKRLRGQSFNAVVIDSVTGLPINDPHIIAGGKRAPDPERDDIDRLVTTQNIDADSMPDEIQKSGNNSDTNSGPSNPYES
ncbi:hypothetical protein [Salinibaculum rarum]|uniref:hypothetical protein n=1 Tax=Salinibaculum rarum TaxID=3058903 RepID=UPI00265FAD8D|nr:hypothetical protein [Salinibaculum sp. KK48]